MDLGLCESAYVAILVVHHPLRRILRTLRGRSSDRAIKSSETDELLVDATPDKPRGLAGPVGLHTNGRSRIGSRYRRDLASSR
jgi:hypothetical protein